jgi:hypothetical protein
MANKKCKHYGTMTLLPCEDKDLEVLDWCFYLEKAIIADCPKDCPHKDKPIQDWE